MIGLLSPISEHLFGDRVRQFMEVLPMKTLRAAFSAFFVNLPYAPKRWGRITVPVLAYTGWLQHTAELFRALYDLTFAESYMDSGHYVINPLILACVFLVKL